MTKFVYLAALIASLLLAAAPRVSSSIPDFTAGGAKQCATFLGDNFMTYAEIPFHSSLNINVFTLEFWINPVSLTPQAIYSCDGAGTDTTGAWNVYVSSAGGIELETNNLGSALSNPSVLTVGTWNHVAVTLASTGKVQFFVNGVIQSSDTAAVARPISLGSRNPLIGRRGFDNKYLNGQLDQMRLWNRVLNSTEIVTNMHSTLNGVGSGLVLELDFDSAPGNVVPNLVAGGATGPTLRQGNYSNAGVVRTGDGTVLPTLNFSSVALQGSVCQEDGQASFAAPLFQATVVDPTAFVEWITVPPSSVGVLHESADGTSRGAVIATVPANSTSPFFVFVPAPDGNGVNFASMTYRGFRGSEATANVATAVISVFSVPDQPVALATTQIGTEDEAVLVYLPGFSADGAVVSAIVASLPDPAAGTLYQSLAGGNLALGSPIDISDNTTAMVYNNNTVIFVPTPDSNGAPLATFQFYVQDRSSLGAFSGCGFDQRIGWLSAATATASVQINAVNDAPIAYSTTQQAKENIDSAIDFTVTDVDSTGLLVVITALPERGQLLVPGSGDGSVPPTPVTSSALLPAGASVPAAGTALPARLLFRAEKDECGMLYAIVKFRAWDGFLLSAEEKQVRIDTYCEAGSHVLYSGLVIFTGTFFGLQAVLSVALIVFTWWYRTRPSMKAHSPPFLMMILLGSLFASLYGFLNLNAAPTDAECGARLWALSLFYLVTFGALYAKEYRIYAIFTSSISKQVHLNDRKLLGRWAVFAGIGVAGLAILTAVSPPQAVASVLSSNPAAQSVQCSYGEATTAVASSYMAIGVLVGAFLAFKTRNLSHDFDESTPILICSYNILFVSLMVGPQLPTLRSQPNQLFILWQLTVLWIATSTVSVLFAPKVLHIIRAANGKDANSAVGTAVVVPGGGTHPSALGTSKAPGTPRSYRTAGRPASPSVTPKATTPRASNAAAAATKESSATGSGSGSRVYSGVNAPREGGGRCNSVNSAGSDVGSAGADVEMGTALNQDTTGPSSEPNSPTVPRAHSNRLDVPQPAAASPSNDADAAGMV